MTNSARIGLRAFHVHQAVSVIGQSVGQVFGPTQRDSSPFH